MIRSRMVTNSAMLTRVSTRVGETGLQVTSKEMKSGSSDPRRWNGSAAQKKSVANTAVRAPPIMRSILSNLSAAQLTNRHVAILPPASSPRQSLSQQERAQCVALTTTTTPLLPDEYSHKASASVKPYTAPQVDTRRSGRAELPPRRLWCAERPLRGQSIGVAHFVQSFGRLKMNCHCSL